MESSDNCGVCGQPLIYATEETTQRCAYCGETFQALIYCPEGHYVCDTCHKLGALEVFRNILDTTESTNPAEILEAAMSHPEVPMHGPEHHAMVPAAIVAAAKNTGAAVSDNAVEKAIERGAKVPGGWCGFYGACGAGIGVGIAVSVLTEATPLTGPTRSLANEATAFALQRIADEGPRCCKRASRAALAAAVEFLRDRLSITLSEAEDLQCLYAERNRECVYDDCAYYQGSASNL